MAEDSLPREYFPAGQVICAAGEPGECAYVIEVGSVEVLSATEQLIATMGPGELFGEMALLDQLPRTATVRALTAATMLRIDRAHIQELLRRTDPVIRHLLTLLLDRFRQRTASGAAPERLPGKAPQDHDETSATRTLMLAQELAYALDNDGLDIVYQPMVGLASEEVAGFETLIRWQHPLLGNITPDSLISLAEKTGLIHRVGHWVLEQSFADWPQLRAACQAAGQQRPILSVNLSAVELIRPDIVGKLGQLLAAAGMEPRELEVELTETLVIEDFDQVICVLRDLAALGVSIALDDFGTGYAGLDYLNKLPISCLKIDRSFVQESGFLTRGLEIVNTANNLAKTLGMTTIVEGIETAYIARQMREMGCDIGQGYFFGHPMPLKTALAWIANPRYRKHLED
ncbi:MAG: EAL domain-containing protein [Pseudomonadota bacterium]|jgi:EAL domain-containing protein (putative c-di-GMP-specific phosphodiesterase class I)